jgi:putative ABC transport system permease protein
MELLRDFRNAARLLLRSPGYAFTCVAILALGIGANTAIFSVIYSVILTPLPYPDPAQLVFVWERFPGMPDPPGGRIQAARWNFVEWQRQNTVFSDMAAFREMAVAETGVEHPRHVSTGFSSVNLFPMLGTRPQLGRIFISREEQRGSDLVAVISDAYFEKRFQRSPNVLGQQLTLGGQRYTVVGVLPRGFHLPATYEGMDQLKPEVWVPLSRLWNNADAEKPRQLLVIARLKPGVHLSQAQTEMAGIASRLAEVHAEQGWTTNIFTIAKEDTSPTLHQALYVMLGAVGCLLLIACANLANLTLARATGRTRETAVRLALGATPWRVIRQLLTESVLISLLGAAGGLVLAHWTIQAMTALEPPELQRPEFIEINVAVFGFTVLLSLITALLFGLAPAWTASRLDLNSAIKVSGGGGASAARSRGRQFLVAAEVGLALMLVTGAGLMIRSFHQMMSTGIGFPVERLTTLDVDLPGSRYRTPESRSQFFRELIRRAREVPGIAAASVVDNLPLHSVSVSNFYIAGQPEPPKESPPMSDFANSSPDYLPMLGSRLIAGRLFSENDLAVNEQEKNGVTIVNQAFATKYFPGENAIGKRLLNSDKKRAFEIVGIVSDYRPMGTENGARPQSFSPYLKLTRGTLVVRTYGAPETMAQSLRGIVSSLDKDLATGEVKTMEKYLDFWISQRRFNTLVLTIFAGVALVLAMMGVYGVLANMVEARTREIGIRMAVGASTADIGKLVVAQSLIPVAIGLAVGLAGSMALSRGLESLLFQVRARDPITVILAILAILIVTPLAIWIPLRRATRVDCTVALRQE